MGKIELTIIGDKSDEIFQPFLKTYLFGVGLVNASLLSLNNNNNLNGQQMKARG